MTFFSKLLNRIQQLHAALFFSYDEKMALLKIKNRFEAYGSKTVTSPFVVVIEGIVCMKFIAIYYSFLLLLLQFKSGRKVQVVLLCGNQRTRYFSASRVYKFFFPVTYVCLDSYLDEDALAVVERETLLLAKQINDPTELFNLSYKGVRVGRDVYYACIRNRLVGTLDVIDSQLVDVLRQYIQNLLIAETLIEKFKPECLLVTDNCYASFSPFFYGFLRQQIPVALTVCFASETGKIGGRIYVSMQNIDSVMRRYTFAFDDVTWDEIRKNYSAADDEIVDSYLEQRFSGNDLTYNGDYHKYTSKLSYESMRRKLRLSESKLNKKVLIAAHLLWDDPGYEGLYRDYELWLKDTLSTIVQNTAVTWILKAHPSEKHIGTSKTARQVFTDIFGDALPAHICFLDSDTDINTYSLIDFVDTVLTVRGTIGFEAACKGKHVVSAGYGPFSGLGFAKEFSDQVEYRNYLLNLHHEETFLKAEQIRNARMGLFGYFIKKTPVSPILLRGEEISKYADLTTFELNSDLTLNRFADKILSKTSGDLL
mgnify:CR=1 FL=1